MKRKRMFMEQNMTRNIDATRMRIQTDIAFVSRGITLKNTRKSVTPRPDEVHSKCNCKGAYGHQVPL